LNKKISIILATIISIIISVSLLPLLTGAINDLTEEQEPFYYTPIDSSYIDGGTKYYRAIYRFTLIEFLALKDNGVIIYRGDIVDNLIEPDSTGTSLTALSLDYRGEEEAFLERHSLIFDDGGITYNDFNILVNDNQFYANIYDNFYQKFSIKFKDYINYFAEKTPALEYNSNPIDPSQPIKTYDDIVEDLGRVDVESITFSIEIDVSLPTIYTENTLIEIMIVNEAKITGTTARLLKILPLVLVAGIVFGAVLLIKKEKDF